MDKIEKLNNDSLFMSELEAIKWQERKEKCLKEDGINEGYALGLEHGISQGINQGLERGYNKGIVEKTNEIILSMIKNNMSLDDISKIINKPIEEIKEIIKEN